MNRSYWYNKIQEYLSIMVLISALVLGGGQGSLGDTVIQLVAVALLVSLVIRAGRLETTPRPLWTWWPMLVLAAIPLIQSLPVPESIWRSLAGRAELAEQLAVAGIEARYRWGLHPIAGERSLFWLLPALALFLATLRMSEQARLRLLQVLLLFAALSVVLGLAQMVGGSDSGLRLYSNTNRSSAVGFFANRNHYALLLAMCLPLAIAQLVRWTAEREPDPALRLLRLGWSGGLCMLLMLGLIVARSRAGLLLGALAVAAVSLLLLLAAWRQRNKLAVAVVIPSILAVAVLLTSMIAIVHRSAVDPVQDQRWAHAQTTWRAAQAYAPLGSGLGTFREVFQPFERDSEAGLGRAVVNHAHNDYLQAWLEAGWLVLPALALILATLLFASVRVLRRAFETTLAHGAVRLGLLVAVPLPLLHSLIDYPLRTSAHLAVLGLLAGCLIAAALPRRCLDRPHARSRVRSSTAPMFRHDGPEREVPRSGRSPC